MKNLIALFTSLLIVSISQTTFAEDLSQAEKIATPVKDLSLEQLKTLADILNNTNVQAEKTTAPSNNLSLEQLKALAAVLNNTNTQTTNNAPVQVAQKEVLQNQVGTAETPNNNDVYAKITQVSAVAKLFGVIE